MSKKKATPAPAAPATADDLDSLAHRIASVLNDPLTPPEVSEGIVDGLTEMFNGAALNGTQRSFTRSYEYVAALLKYFGREEGAGGGA